MAKKIGIIFVGIVLLALGIGGYLIYKTKTPKTLSVPQIKNSDIPTNSNTQTQVTDVSSTGIAAPSPANNTAANTTQIELILDDSGSMAEAAGGQAKINIAKDSMNKIIDELKTKANLEVALRIYGHQNKECTNSIVEIPMSRINPYLLKSKIKDLQPLGYTPIYYSLTQSVNDFDQNIAGDKVIVLITDGLESCNGDPCAAAKALQAGGVISQINVVGFGLTQTEINTLQCIVEPSKGIIVGANNPTEFMSAMQKIINKTMDKSNLNVSVIGADGKPIQASDICVYPQGQTDKEVVCAGMYTSEFGFTMKPGIYDLKAVNGGTSSETWIKNIEIKTRETVQKVISFAEGKLVVSVVGSDGNPTQASDICVYPAGVTNKEESCAGMFTADNTFTLKPGVYDVKVSNYDNNHDIWSKNIEIKASQTITRKITL
jgi:hypothetical protein